ncbi:hypothetical protein PQQ52_27285 [Paraburkholderia sediminicola]|uniref:hypothetical protein n=1 Tax=Paraburkholderia sediminicola TaxID=458836 RepID=UPI0038B920E7
MTFRTAALAAATASFALITAASPLTVNAQMPPDSQWRASSLMLATLLQDGYKIAAVVNGAHVDSGSANTIFVQRDQSAFKCIDPSPADTKTKAACFELVQPSGAASESK